MGNDALQENLYWQLVQVSLRAKRGLITMAEKYDLGVMQMFTLFLLKPNQPLPMSSISETLCCDASNITGIVDRLHSQGYIKRQENPKDRRLKMLSLTPKGTKLCAKLLKEIPNYHPANLNDLNSSQAKQLRQLLTLALEPSTD